MALFQQPSHFVRLGDENIPISVLRHRRARRIILRIDPIAREVLLTLPRRASLKDGLAFARSKQQWLAANLRTLPEQIPFAEGSAIPLQGISHLIRHAPERRGTVHLENETLHVCGDPAFLSRRLSDWLKRQARARITPLAHEKAASINRTIGRISLRDTRSRWGSCSDDGNLSFSWRLILAPPEVLEYVVSHEVAHLVELNHSPRFWKIVADLCPHHQSSRAWLRANAQSLYRYGR